jgi:hypothetical protein
VSAVSEVVGRVPARLWERLAYWLIGLERDKLSADITVKLGVSRGVVVRVEVQPPAEVVTRGTND